MQQPETLRDLLDLAAHPLWHGLTYEKTAKRNIEEFIAIVGDIPLNEVTTLTMDAWCADREREVGPATINRKLTNIHSLLKFALDREWMVRLPKMPWKRESEGRIRWVTLDEEARMLHLLSSWGEHNAAAFLTVLIETGMRRGELLRLQPEDVDGQWARLWKTKTKFARSVPLTARAQEALADRLPWRLDAVKLRRVWDRLRKEMQLVDDPDFVLHTLRHTAATRFLRKTKNIALVQRLLGHKKVTTTMRYAHIDDQDLLHAVVG
jgi:integrase